MRKKYLIFLVFSSLLIQSCNKIDDPFIPLAPKEWYGKRALIEDYTGHFCPNCPDAAVKAALIDSIYGDKVVIIAIHCTDYFSRPRPPQFPEDFRTETGNLWTDFFGIANLPSGMINRINFPQKTHILTHDTWASNVSTVLSQIPEVDININLSYDTISKKITGSATTKFLKTIKKKLQLQLLLTEDSIIAPQQNHSVLQTNYVHRHMMRDAINGSWGSSLTSGISSNLIDSEILYPFVYTIKQNFSQDTPGINWKHASIVAFVYDTDTYEILQVAQKHLN